MISAVLDASALLALLRNEAGAGKVSAALASSAMSTINLAEVVGHFARNGVSEQEIRQVLSPLPIEWQPFDEGLAYHVGVMLPATQPHGLSLGDRACLALARHLGAPARTADRQWAALPASLGVAVDLIR
jgi:PIN domain nuclease of toxin-antitoxin system